MTTLTTSIRLMQTELYNRNRIFEDTSGVGLDGPISTQNFDLRIPVKLGGIDNFIMISTDATIEIVLSQVSVDQNNVQKINEIVVPISAFFLAYSKFPNLVLRPIAGTKRVPKISVVYA